MRIFLLFVLLVTSAVAQSEPIEAEPAPELDAMFERTSGWTGADGDYSVSLGDGRIAWLFSDTWVGRIEDGGHRDSKLINNSVGIQSGKSLEFYFGPEPSALIAPADGRGWFWIYDGILIGRTLYLFLIQTERRADDGFRHVGMSLGAVENPSDAPDRWRITQSKLPFGSFSEKGDILFGSAVMRRGGDVYVYGTDETIDAAGFHHKAMVVARVAASKLSDWNSWRFFDGRRWRRGWRSAGRIADGFANEFSVSFQRSIGKFVAVYTKDGISPEIVVRTSKHPNRDWSNPRTVFKCPESEWDKRIICYAAKAHPELSNSDDELIVSYIASSTDFWHLASDARLYRPRFVRLKIPGDRRRRV